MDEAGTFKDENVAAMRRATEEAAAAAAAAAGDNDGASANGPLALL